MACASDNCHYVNLEMQRPAVPARAPPPPCPAPPTPAAERGGGTIAPLKTYEKILTFPYGALAGHDPGTFWAHNFLKLAY
jgi:hypothetical protein